MAVQWIRLLVAGFSQRKIGHSTSSVHMWFVLGSVARKDVSHKTSGFPFQCTNSQYSFM
jgi:hypothetical protein